MLKKDITHKGYFEGVLQVRNATPEVFAYVDEQIEALELHVAKIDTTKDGADYYVGDNTLLLKLGRRLKDKFSGELKTSSRLFTQSKETSKLVYRGTVLFRYIPFKVSDIVELRGQIAEVLRFGPKVEVKHKSTGKRELITYERFLKEAKVMQER